jgi:hypothetical protein
MGWGLNSRACEERVKAQYVQCSDCDYCRSIGGGRNRCTKREGVTFWTNAPHLCKNHSSVEWREKMIEELKKKERGE